MGKNQKMMCIYFFMGILEKQEFYNLQIKLQLNKRCAQKSKSLINRPIGGRLGQINHI